MSKLFRQKLRKEGGVSMIVLTLIIAFFAVLPLSLLTFEVSRYFLIQSELQHVLDCAALSGTAALAQPATASTTSAASLVQSNAMNAAIANFESNGVLKIAFNPSNCQVFPNTGVNNANPAYQNAILNIVLADQQGNPQTTGSLTATTMQVSAAYTDAPIFSSTNNGISPLAGTFTVRASAIGGLPQLDLVLCFDCSGSMDDSTPVFFVNRHWNGSTKQVEYVTIAGTGAATDTIYSFTKPLETGTSLNAAFPQQLSFADYGVPTTQNASPFIFSEGPQFNPGFGGTNLLKGLRANLSFSTNSAIPEQGCPPGNFDPTNPTSTTGNGINWQAYPNLGFTDMVCVPPGYNVNYAVEASRGNLNSAALLKSAMGGNATPSTQLTGFTIATNAYSTYWSAVNSTVQPMFSAQQAAVNFFNQMNTSTNVHISLITFASTASGPTASVQYTDTNNTLNDNVDGNFAGGGGWAGGGVGSWQLPYVPLQQNSFVLQNVINAVQGAPASGTTAAIQPLNAQNGTDIADALQNAIGELTNPALVRPAAKKAIVLFTDGIPTLPTNQTAGTTAALAQAALANKANIPIYTIGLSTNTAIAPQEAIVLGDNLNGSGQGIAFISGVGATYNPVTTPIALQNAFQKIARSLVVLQSQK
jgi:hypothetical protein